MLWDAPQLKVIRNLHLSHVLFAANLLRIYLFYMYKLIALILCLTFAKAHADCKRVDADLKIFDNEIQQMVDTFYKLTINYADRNWVIKYVDHMYAKDQHMRRTAIELPFKQRYSKEETDCFWQSFVPRWNRIDTLNTEALKSLMEPYTWFWISDFNEVTNDQAWTLAQHADHDPSFQRQVLTLLENSHFLGQTKPKHYAYLFDRVAWMVDKKPQRYGTQGYCKEPGNWQPHPTEDFLEVNARRKAMGMESIEAYKAKIDTMCH